jgi:hypothetical protein
MSSLQCTRDHKKSDHKSQFFSFCTFCHWSNRVECVTEISTVKSQKQMDANDLRIEYNGKFISAANITFSTVHTHTRTLFRFKIHVNNTCISLSASSFPKLYFSPCHTQ